MTLQPLERSPESLLQRIDAILGELLSLRQEIQLQTQREHRLDQLAKSQRVDIAQSSVDIVDELYGSLGQGSWDEIEFDINTKWERFSQ
jgi:hypothetical protein